MPPSPMRTIRSLIGATALPTRSRRPGRASRRGEARACRRGRVRPDERDVEIDATRSESCNCPEPTPWRRSTRAPLPFDRRTRRRQELHPPQPVLGRLDEPSGPLEDDVRRNRRSDARRRRVPPSRSVAARSKSPTTTWSPSNSASSSASIELAQAPKAPCEWIEPTTRDPDGSSASSSVWLTETRLTFCCGHESDRSPRPPTARRTSASVA